MNAAHVEGEVIDVGDDGVNAVEEEEADVDAEETGTERVLYVHAGRPRKSAMVPGVTVGSCSP